MRFPIFSGREALYPFTDILNVWRVLHASTKTQSVCNRQQKVMRLVNYHRFYSRWLEEPGCQNNHKGTGQFLFFKEHPLRGSEYKASKFNLWFPVPWLWRLDRPSSVWVLFWIGFIVEIQRSVPGEMSFGNMFRLRTNPSFKLIHAPGMVDLGVFRKNPFNFHGEHQGLYHLANAEFIGVRRPLGRSITDAMIS